MKYMFLGTLILIALLVLLVFIVYSSIKRKKEDEYALDMVILKILIPKKESDKDDQKENSSGIQKFQDAVAIAEQLYTGLHSTYKNKWVNKLFGQDHISLELTAYGNEIYYYLVIPKKLYPLIEKQVTAFFPDIILEENEDAPIFAENSIQKSAYLKLEKGFEYSLKTYQNAESDPMNSIINAISKVGEDEGACIQTLIRPRKNGWQKEVKELVKKLAKGEESGGNLLSKMFGFINTILTGSDKDNESQTPEVRTPLSDELHKSLENKSRKIGFETVIRIITSSKDEFSAEAHLTNILSSFIQFGEPDLNSFVDFTPKNSKNSVIKYIKRSFSTPRKINPSKMILGAEELASFYHFPNIRFNKSSALNWQNFKIAPAPSNVPKTRESDGDLHLGHNVYRGVKTPVYMRFEDRFRHFYLIGQTGTGKSQMLSYMARQDLKNKKVGMCFIDPHGDEAEDLLGWIPRERADDIVFFDPSDIERPMGLNLLEADTPEEKDFIALEAMNMMVKMFGNEIFGPRIQDYFRNGCLTLMDNPEGGCITDIVKLFTDEAYQKVLVEKVKNPIVKSFWTQQMAMTGDREKKEMIPYFAAKFGQFITNTMIRNIMGQKKSSFDIAKIMDEGKILLVKLSKGLIGDINANLLGMIIVNKIQVAAMKRQNMPKEKRTPFFLYVDEFQNFVTDAFESILSEARKYRLGLIVAHQYIDQLLDTGLGSKGGAQEKVKNAVFGNVGTMMNLKIGAKDAEYLVKEMAPIFSEQDLINLPGFNACLKLNIDNKISQPFSVQTQKTWLIPEKRDKEAADAFKQISRLTYGREKKFVDKEILARLGVPIE